MGRRFHLAVTGLLLATMVVGYFVYAPLMPERIAQHFDGAGRPDAYTTRGGFWTFVVLFTAFMLASMHGLGLAMSRMPTAWFSLPARDYWLAPPRRAQSLAALESWMLGYGNLTLAFIIYVLWRAVRANVEGGTLDGVLPALWVFMGLTLLAVVQLIWRFRPGAAREG